MTLRKHSYNNVPSLTDPVALDEMPKRTSSQRRRTNVLALTATTLFASGVAQATATWDCPYQGSGTKSIGVNHEVYNAASPCSLGKRWTASTGGVTKLYNQSGSNRFVIYGDGTQGGLLLINGRFSNAGTVTVQSGAMLGASGYTWGDHTSDGTINNQTSGILINEGTVYTKPITKASAILTNAGSVENHANAMLTNAGSLTNQTGGSLTNNGTVDNTGTFTNQSGASLKTYGGLNNQTGGSLSNAGTLTNEGGAILTNAGTLTETSGGTLTNNGTITTTGIFTQYAGSTVTGTGTFTQSAGTTTVNGSLTQTTINLDGGTLNGSGTITGTINQNGGTFSPGNSPGTITINGDYYVNGTVAIQLYDQKPGFYDIVDVNGVVTFGSNALIDIDLTQNATQAVGQFWDFIWSDTTFVNSQNVHYEVTGLAAGLGYSIHEVSVGNRNVLEFSLVPEPSSFALFGIGLAGLGFARKRARPT